MTVKLEIPDEIYRSAVEAAARLSTSLDEFIALAVERYLTVLEARNQPDEQSLPLSNHVD